MPDAHDAKVGSSASDLQVGAKEMEEEKPWYHHASDFSIDHEPPRSAGEAGVVPYHQVGSNKHNRRNASSGVIDTRGARLSTLNSVQLPYSDDSSLPRLPRPPPANVHFHTVVV